MIIINFREGISDLHAEIIRTIARPGKILPVREIETWVHSDLICEMHM
jgi:hypothetical protein